MVVFIKGLIPSLKTIVKSQKPSTLELAIPVSKDEETELKSDSGAYQYYWGNGSSRQVNNSTGINNNYSNRRNNNFINDNRYQNNNYSAPNNNRPNYSNNNFLGKIIIQEKILIYT